MEQSIIKNSKLSEEYYIYKHQSGLSILLYPMKEFSSAYAIFGTNYGSIDTCFKTYEDKDFINVPEGIAHFLEHKLFESEDGDAFSLFAKTGASANAFTSFDKTCYLFSTTDNFEDSLKSLITFVLEPYFTDETVLKEQGIIGQEINMYQDNPDWRVFFNLLSILYVKHSVRIDIAGTNQSIAKIDKDLLYKCYNAFYNLNNMVVAVAGNFDKEKAVEIITNNLKAHKDVGLEVKTVDEPRDVMSNEKTQELQVAMPLFHIGYKEEYPGYENELEVQIYYELILNAIAGKSSSLYSKMYYEGLINDSFSKEAMIGRGYFCGIFGGESREPKVVQEYISQEISKLKKQGIDCNTFNRIKKFMYGRNILALNDVDNVANSLVSSYFNGHSVYDAINIIENMDIKKANEILLTSFDERYSAISIVNPIKE